MSASSRARFASPRVRRWTPVAAAGCFVVVAFCGAKPAVAQEPAVVSFAVGGTALVEYHADQTGGRIRIAASLPDSAAIERIRVQLLENAAAIRRGDFRSVRLFPATDPALQVLVGRRAAVRCTFRFTPRGGELLLLSDDDAVVTAIHQLFATLPQRPARS